MFTLENSIKNWQKKLRKHQAFDEGSIHEMEVHLRDHIEDLVRNGASEEEAFNQAVEEFGAINPVAKEEFSNLRSGNRLRSFLFTTMLNNYFKTSMRSMWKNPLSSFINVFGLAVAIGACLVTYAFIDFDMSIDRFHVNKDKTFISTYYVNREGTTEQYGTSPAPLGNMLKEDFSSIEEVCRIQDADVVVKYEENVFHERIRYVDKTFLDIFTFPLKYGTSSSLADPNSIILSHKMALKYFDEINPVEQELKVIFVDGSSKAFKVTGVAEEFPKAQIIGFDFLLNFQNIDRSYPDKDLNAWDELIAGTVIMVSDPAKVKDIKSKMEPYIQFQNETDSDWPISAFNFVSIHDLHLTSKLIRNDISYDASEEGRVGLPFIASFILALACFNFINIAIVSATKRLKEIGLRKVIGANRRLLVFQFLSENLFMTTLAGVVGLILAITIILPWFSSFAGIASEFDLWDHNLWLFLISVLFFTSILSGLYPAIYISGFQAVTIFRGKLKFGRKSTMTKIFLTLQLALACVGMSFAVIYHQNSNYQEVREWGYDQSQTLYARLADQQSLNQLHDAMSGEAMVERIAASQHHFSKSQKTSVLHLPDHQYEVKQLNVSDEYLQTLGVQLSKGRFFKEDFKSDYSAIIVNELFVDNLQGQDPLGLKVKIEGESYEVVGVVKDFHFNNFYYENQPTVFALSQPENDRFLAFRVQDGAQYEVYKKLQQQWSTLFPESPFQGGYQEDTWEGFYQDLNTQKRFSKAIAFVFVLLASLGLYGLLQLNIAGRIREFSIRKTLGAQAKNIAGNILKQYRVIIVVALILGIPMGHLLNNAMLDMMYPDPRPFGYSGSVLAAFLLIVVLAVVISTQVRRIVKSNPVEGLKVE